MSTHLPITDEDRRKHRETTERKLSDLLPAAPEQPADMRSQLPASTWRQLAGAVLIIALMALLAWLAFRPAVTDQPPTTSPTSAPAALAASPAPTSAPAQITAYAAPDGAPLGPIDAGAKPQYRHSAHPGWGGVRWQGAIVWVQAEAEQIAGLPDLAPPTPAPTPERIYVPVEPPCDLAVSPRYVARIDVSAADGRPLGQVTGASCESQAAAQADAEQRAVELRQAAPPPCPTWHPPLKQPDCAP